MSFRRFDLLVFDLDGTLVDAFQDITNAVNAALAAWGIAPKSKEQVTACVGHGVRRLMEQILGGAPVPLEEALARMKAYYADHPADTAQLYPGVAETLAALDRAGYMLAVLSNKIEALTCTIIRALGIAPYIDRTVGDSDRYPRKPDPSALLDLIASLGTQPTRTLMVGDNTTDLEVAQNAGCAFCGVTYGARDRAFWEAAGVLFIVDQFADLPRAIGEP